MSLSGECLFCKILTGELPSQKVFENEEVYAFKDTMPQAPVHLLFIHKNHTENINKMSSKDITSIYEAIKQYTQKEEIDKKGFRIIINSGEKAGQSVFHTHFHILSSFK